MKRRLRSRTRGRGVRDRTFRAVDMRYGQRRLLCRIVTLTRVRARSFFATILNFSLPRVTPVTRAWSDVRRRIFVTVSFFGRAEAEESVRATTAPSRTI